MNRKTGLFIWIIIILLLVLVLTAAFAFKIFTGYNIAIASPTSEYEKNEAAVKRSPVYEKRDRSIGESKVEYFLDEDGRYIPQYDLDENEYDPSLFKSENGRVRYDSDKVRYGIDVSSHQGNIDWQKVAADGVDYAIIRAAYRAYGSSGQLNEDEYFHINAEKALAAGLDIGAYVFSQAVSVEEAIEEAEFVLDIVKDYDIEYPLVFDWEPIRGDSARTDNVTSVELTEFALAFCEKVEEAGYDGAVYLNTSQGYMEYNLESISECEIWLAQYSEVPDFYYSFNMWQYTNKGAVDGISGSVDMNISFKNYAG